MASANQMQQYVQRVAQAIRAYNSNPDMFTDEEIGQISNMAAQVGVPFSPQFSTRRAVARSIFELADTALLGLLPNSWAPTAYGTEQTVADVAGLLGLAVPGAIGVKAATGAAAGVARLGKGLGVLGKAKKGASLAQKAKAAAESIPLIGGYGKVSKPVASALKSIDAALKNKRVIDAAKAINASKWGTRAITWPVGIGTTLALNDIFDEGSPAGVPSDEELALMQSLQ